MKKGIHPENYRFVVVKDKIPASPPTKKSHAKREGGTNAGRQVWEFLLFVLKCF